MSELTDRPITYEELSPYPKIRQRQWPEKVYRPTEQAALTRIRRSSATGLPYRDQARVAWLAKKLDLDLTIRPRARLRQ